MNCDKCGRPIKRGYKWNEQTLGIECYKSCNPYYNDPAQAVYQAAAAVLDGDKSPMRQLPNVWYIMSNSNAIDNAIAHQSHDESKKSVAYWLAIITHNKVAKKLYPMGYKSFCVGKYDRFE